MCGEFEPLISLKQSQWFVACAGSLFKQDLHLIGEVNWGEEPEVARKVPTGEFLDAGDLLCMSGLGKALKDFP